MVKSNRERYGPEYSRECRHWPGCNLQLKPGEDPYYLSCAVCTEGGHRYQIRPMTLDRAATMMAEALETMILHVRYPGADVSHRMTSIDQATEAIAAYSQAKGEG